MHDCLNIITKLALDMVKDGIWILLINILILVFLQVKRIMKKQIQ